jgi:hypothetical protein
MQSSGQQSERTEREQAERTSSASGAGEACGVGDELVHVVDVRAMNGREWMSEGARSESG